MSRREENEKKILDYIKSCEKRSFGPSRRELSEQTGISLGVIQTMVRRLADDGRIEYTPAVARSIRMKKRNR